MASLKSVLMPCAVAIAAIAAVTVTDGCFVPPDDVRAGASGGSTSPTGPSGGGQVPGSGLPCDISAILAAHCQSCHGDPLFAPMPLLTYADLTASAVSDPARTVASLALERMESTSAPMPPGSAPTVDVADRDAFRAWIDAGLPKGECGGSEGTSTGAGGDPAPIATVCSSERFWEMDEDNVLPSGKEVDEEGPWMNPGLACIKCHMDEEEDDGPFVLLGGTLYPTLREPDLCFGVNGAATGAVVVVTDAKQHTFSMPVGQTGNFSLPVGMGPVSFPITAKVVVDSKERMMSTPQMSGDCNGCHTEQGKNGAPGRIFLP